MSFQRLRRNWGRQEPRFLLAVHQGRLSRPFLWASNEVENARVSRHQCKVPLLQCQRMHWAPKVPSYDASNYWKMETKWIQIGYRKCCQSHHQISVSVLFGTAVIFHPPGLYNLVREQKSSSNYHRNLGGQYGSHEDGHLPCLKELLPLVPIPLDVPQELVMKSEKSSQAWMIDWI